MRKSTLALLALVLAAAAAFGQGGQAPSGRVSGNPGAVTALPQWATLTAMFDRAFCATNGDVVTRQAGTWDCEVYGTFTGAVLATGTLSPSQITSNQNDYTGGGCTAVIALRLSTDASRSITGLSCGQAPGRLITALNIGAQDLVLEDEDAASTAANRFALGGDVTVGAGRSFTLWYDGVSTRWRAVASPAAAGVGTGTVTSVTLTLPTSVFDLSGCTITTSGTCAITFDNQSANTFFAGPASGSAATPAFRAPVGSDGASKVLLACRTASSSSTLDFDNLISATYTNYSLELSAITPATNDAALYIRVGTGGTPTYQTTSYLWGGLGIGGGGNVGVGSTTNSITTDIALSGVGSNIQVANAATRAGGFGGVVAVATGARTSITVLATYVTGGGSYSTMTGGGFWDDGSAAVTSLRLRFNTGNIASGTACLYGHRIT